MARSSTNQPKLCKKCGRPKSKGYYCRPCENARKRDTYYASDALYRQSHRHLARLANWKNYGIKKPPTEREYDQLIADCNGHCPACGREAKKLCLHHNHETGEWIGLLCDDCNLAAGRMRDNFVLIQALADYMRTYHR